MAKEYNLHKNSEWSGDLDNKISLYQKMYVMHCIKGPFGLLGDTVFFICLLVCLFVLSQDRNKSFI